MRQLHELLWFWHWSVSEQAEGEWASATVNTQKERQAQTHRHRHRHTDTHRGAQKCLTFAREQLLKLLLLSPQGIITFACLSSQQRAG